MMDINCHLIVGSVIMNFALLRMHNIEEDFGIGTSDSLKIMHHMIDVQFKK